MIKISDYLDPRLVAFLDVDNRDEAIQTLVSMIHQTGKLQDKYAFYEAIIEREKIVSTGIGMGAAIPHAKLTSYDEFFIAIGVLRKGLDWNALDGSPVRIIFLIGGPDDKQTEYLQILSKLTQVIKDDQIRKKMLTLNSPEDMIELFK
ncbi:MAG TPA: PTS sugar transporter subunit IIA [Parachlamydiaceae bacterium]|nr:PTS sugar transporter subunit IIA [Parachlamydiaceae bacterium]